MSLFNIGFVIFPELTQLDFTGPLQVLSRLPQSATHCCKIGRARPERLWTWPRADAHLCELSASRLDLHTGRK
jgi:hypothetical protein